ncbi:indolepyruvate oxidoreductase subunit beta [Candidatus Formimonas warabiya]|uniref:indolepyruvate oxidoreductase subunit beta n=1 Tax=Formimonas warabiya TaxID=1761012 RepID=UPI0030016758
MGTNVLFVGVGGQGIILASKLLAAGLVQLGYDVKMSEIHGMAQRGGSVTTQVRFGEKVYSPCIGTGEADVVVTFEKVEAVRYLGQLKPEGTLIVNDCEIYSLPVVIGQEKYPENIIEKLKEEVKELKVVDAANIALDLGNIKAQNIVILGVLVKALGLERVNWKEILETYFRGDILDLNVKALDAGINL